MKILQCINALTYGGAQTILFDISEALLKKGFEVQVVAFRDGPIGNRLRSLGLKVHIIGENYCDIPAFFRLRKIIKTFRPAIVHSHLFKTNLLTRLAQPEHKNFKLISSIHGKENKLFHAAEKLLRTKTDHFVFPSNYLLDWFKKEISPIVPDKYSIIYPGVNLNDHEQERRKKSNLVSIGTLSRLHPVKGIDRLIKACKQLKKENIEFKLIIGGDGKESQNLLNLVEQANLTQQTIFTGPIENKSEFLSTLDIFVAPSREESFGIHICEAMERSIPVVASNIGGLPEIIEDKYSGFLIDPQNKENLVSLLKKLITNSKLRYKIGKSGRERILKLFKKEASISKYMQLYQEISRNTDKKALFAISSSEIGGGENLATELMLSLKQKGWKISALVSGEPLFSSLKNKGISVSLASMRAGGAFYWLKLLKLTKKQKPSVISSHLNRASLFSGLTSKLLKVPVVAHVHGLNRISYYQHCNHLIAVSKAVENHLLEQGMAKTNISTLPNCIAKKPIPDLDFTRQNNSIGIVAKLHQNKGHLWALEAIEDSIELFPELKIHIFGDGPEKENLTKRFSNGPLSSRLKFHGFVKNIDDYYPQIDVTLLPSLGEGIPLSLLEAMRYGIPALATRIGGIPEIIADGCNGILVEPQDKKALISGLKKLLNPNIRVRFSENAVKSFAKLNNYSEMIGKFEAKLLQYAQSKS